MREKILEMWQEYLLSVFEKRYWNISSDISDKVSLIVEEIYSDMIDYWFVGLSEECFINNFNNYLLFKERWLLEDKNNSYILESFHHVTNEDFFEHDTSDIKRKLELLEEIWFKTLDELYCIKQAFARSKVENLEYVIRELWIANEDWTIDKDDINHLFYVMEYNSKKTIASTSDFIKKELWITKKRNLVELVDWLVPVYKDNNLYEKMKILKSLWINDENGFMRFRDTLRLMKLNLLEFISLDENLSNEKKLDLILKNTYVKNDNYLIFWNFKYKRPNIDDFALLLKCRYNKWIFSNHYVGEKVRHPFSLMNSKVSYILSWKQIMWKQMNIWEESYYSTNADKWLLPESQKIISDIFASFFPMARMKKVMNWKSEYVSVDVNSDEWIEICWFDSNVPERLKNFIRMIYQYLTLDWDKVERRNLTKEGIYFDYDLALVTPTFYEDIDFYEGIFHDKKLHEEFKQIFCLVKNYVHMYCEEEMDRYEEELQSNKLDDSKIKILKSNISLLKRILNREQQFTMSNLVSSLWIDNEKILDFAFKSDIEMFV